MNKVVQIHRQSFPGQFSIEGIFKVLRAEISNSLSVKPFTVPKFSKGLFPRIRNAFACKRLEADVYHVTGDIHYVALGLPREKTILTIHDCEMLDRLSGFARVVAKLFWFSLPIRSVRYVTTISEATKSDLMRNVRVDSDRVIVIPDCISPVFVPRPKVFNEAKPRILQIGTKHNKNIPRLIKALEGVPCHLRIIGPMNNALESALKVLEVEFSSATNLSEEEIVQEYVQADIVTLVSTKEGFGLPIVEAQTVERVVITSNLSSMPEVGGDGAFYVDPFSVSSMREGILRVVQCEELREALILAGRKNRERYSPSMVAEQYASLYSRIVEDFVT